MELSSHHPSHQQMVLNRPMVHMVTLLIIHKILGEKAIGKEEKGRGKEKEKEEEEKDHQVVEKDSMEIILLDGKNNILEITLNIN